MTSLFSRDRGVKGVVRDEDGCDGMGTGSAVNEGAESGAAEDTIAVADDARTDAGQTESPSPAAEEEMKEEQDTNSSTTSAKTTTKSSKCEDFTLFFELSVALFYL